MQSFGKFTIGLQVISIVKGEPVYKLRIIYSAHYITYEDAKALADKHREFIKNENDTTGQLYDYEWQQDSVVIS